MGRERKPSVAMVYLEGRAMTIDEWVLLARLAVVESQRGGWARMMVGAARLRAAVKAWAAFVPSPMVVGTPCTMNLLHRLLARRVVGLMRRPFKASSISNWYLAASEADTEGGVRRTIFLLLVVEADKKTNWWRETAVLTA